MSEQSFQPIADDEISIKDIVDFLVESWKAIIAAGLLGVAAALTFVMVTPSQYEATAQIQMAQISINNNNTNPLGSNVELPSLLIARHQVPSTYTEDEIKACGLEGKKMPQEALSKLAKFTPVKGVDSIVELKIRLESKEGALACAQALFENVKESQSLIIKPYIEEAKSLLAKYQVRLQETQSLVAKADKSGSALSAAYLANRDEVKFLTDESIRLNALITSGDARQTKLVAPVYVSDLPVFPKKRISLVLGLLAGLLVGLLLVLLRKAWNSYKAGTK
ncbi:MAG: hypothetical protein E6Q68_05950 [Polynucleobacter sp.]|nr:MAG: hypothetical protein E6Q68_05950 [Polynucleobacter sp.]